MGYSFVIPGIPVIQARPRLGRGRVYDPSGKAKKRIGYTMLQARSALKVSILGGSIKLQADFYGLARGDLDNAIKALLDAANGVLWTDDSQVCEINARCFRQDANPRTEIILEEVGL